MTQAVMLGSRVREPSSPDLRRATLLLLALMTLPPMFYFCGDPGADRPPEATDPDAGLTGEQRVFFISPADEATVRTPFHVSLGAELFKIEPAANNAEANDRGHFHLMIDTPCLAHGEKMYPDAFRIDLERGETEIVLSLLPGHHHLCLQAATANHLALPLTAFLHVEVVE